MPHASDQISEKEMIVRTSQLAGMEKFYISQYGSSQAFVQHRKMLSLDRLRSSNDTDFQGELRAFVLLPENHGDLQSWSGPPDLR